MRSQSEQERFDNRRWLDFEDVPAGTVGAYVRVGNRSFLAQPDGDVMTEHVVSFLQRAGISCQRAVPVGVGATTSGGFEAVFQFMKPIGITIQLVRFTLAWQARVTRRQRQRLLPAALVVLLADHIKPRQVTADEWEDMASVLVTILPDLQKDLEAEYPSCNFRFEFRALGKNVPLFKLDAGDGVPVTDKNVLQMRKHLERKAERLTLYHREGWFAIPKVVPVHFVARPVPARGPKHR